MSEDPGDVDEFDEYLAGQMKDPGFRAAYGAAVARRARAHRNPWNRFRHWVHARTHPELHAEKCSKCRRT